MRKIKIKRKVGGGFSLVEIVLALGILSFAVLTVIGLLGTAMTSNTESEGRLQAANVATLVLAQYREVLNGSGGDPAPLPGPGAIGSSSPGDFGDPHPIGLDGKPVGRDEASFALRSSVWEDDRFSADSPYRLIKCAVRLEWPARAALAAGDSDDRNLGTYSATTSFLIARQ